MVSQQFETDEAVVIMILRILVVLIVLVSAVASSPAAAEGTVVRLGARVGGNYSILTRPADPLGEPTLASGAGFSGMGFVGGLAAMYPVSKTRSGRWGLELDVLYSVHSGRALEEIPAAGQARETEFKTSMVRVPLLLGYTHRLGKLGVRLAAGPELLLAISSEATVTQDNIPGEPTSLFTTPVTHVGVTAALAAEYRFSKWMIPLEFRFTWDPMVPSTTVERFENFVDADSPGNFQVAFDYQFFLMIGVDRLLLLD